MQMQINKQPSQVYPEPSLANTTEVSFAVSINHDSCMKNQGNSSILTPFFLDFLKHSMPNTAVTYALQMLNSFCFKAGWLAGIDFGR